MFSLVCRFCFSFLWYSFCLNKPSYISDTIFSNFYLLTKYKERLGELGLFSLKMSRQREPKSCHSLSMGKAIEKTEPNPSSKCSAKGHETNVTIALTRQEEEILRGESRSVLEETTQRGWGISILVDFQKPAGQTHLQPDLSLLLALLWARYGTGWPPGVLSNLNFPTLPWKST